MQREVKSDTRLDKIRSDDALGRLKSTERSAGGTAEDTGDASQVPSPSERQRRWDCRHRYRTGLPQNPVIVPVLAPDGEPLMPTCASRARRWVKERKATPFWLNGVWCVRLKFEPAERNKQDIVVGIDPGSKREAFTVASKAHTYLNVLADAVHWVKDSVHTRKILRHFRRKRNTPCRKIRTNRNRYRLAPSTKARWQIKLRILAQLRKMFPITGHAIEDIKAPTHKKRKCWNACFSPVEIGKNWMYEELSKLGELTIKAGYETFELRKKFGVVKTHVDKMAMRFDVHNVDSWVLAKDALGYKGKPENTQIVHCFQRKFHRRVLHYQNPIKGGGRRKMGGTMSQGLKRGSLVKHPKYGLTTVGGNQKGRVSLHDLSGKRLCEKAKVKDIKVLRRISLIFIKC
jgi:hypothetical protein